MVLLIYVDDVILASDSLEQIAIVKKYLHDSFTIKDLGELKYFLGIEVARSKKGISLCQRKYALDILQDSGLSASKPVAFPMESNLKLSAHDSSPLLTDPAAYRRLVGRLLYLTITRPDLAYSVQALSQFMASPTTCHLQTAHRVLRYIKATPGQGIFLAANSQLHLKGYSDSDWGGCLDTRRSITGFAIFIGDSLISWKSKKQHAVSRSSAESEYRALASTTCELQWLVYLLADLNVQHSEAALLYTDSKPAAAIASNPVQHERTKHIQLDCHLVREKLQEGLINIIHIPSKYQIADILTKPLGSLSFHHLIRKMGMINIHSHLEGGQSVGLDSRGRATANASHPLSFDAKDQGIYGLPKKNSTVGYFSRYYTSSRWISSRVLSSMASSTHSGQFSWENGAPVAKFQRLEMEFSRVNRLVLSGTGPALAMAWVGKDVHYWHKRIAYQVVVYVLMKMAVEVEILLSSERRNDTSLAREILSPKHEAMRQSGLEEWFKEVELPRIAGFFLPIGVAGIIVAISCCAAVRKLGSKRTCCHLFTFSIEDVLVQLMDLSHGLVSVDKLHHLATEAGFELDFLTHFGTEVFSGNASEELEFWIGLAQKKLSVAFHKEAAKFFTTSFVEGTNRFFFLFLMSKLMEHMDLCELYRHVQADSLATLGLFAYLGKRTRIFLSGKSINDLDDHVKDFLSYLERGSLFIFPELSSILVYQLFMEREIILTTVFTVCYDIFSGFAHFSRSTLKPLDADLLEFLLRSQSLLTICLEDYWAAYDKSGELIKFSETVVSDPTSFARSKAAIKFSIVSDIWMGMRLLFTDFMVALELLLNQLRGHRVTERETKKLKRTLNDIASLIPVTILMLLPVSAIGHAAMLAAIKKYMPYLLPSPYSPSGWMS
ncbi:hypothetical protein I3760_02G147600 [Carya illinoinensis]|nr:hypothetical protein I3760_02G147600 [Carya illinoinensis]